jgi:RNA polymerase sigma factor (TIGR02999 family)
MNEDVTRILSAIRGGGDPSAARGLLPLVYDELRKLAALRMANERPGHTLQATALVHEAYMRLVGTDDPGWHNRGHFFAAAAEAMRRLLVDHARSKRADKRGGGDRERIALDAVADLAVAAEPDDLLLLDETLSELGRHDPLSAKLVELRYFAGLSVDEAAAVAGVSTATAYRHWSFARAWILERIGRRDGPAPEV